MVKPLRRFLLAGLLLMITVALLPSTALGSTITGSSNSSVYSLMNKKTEASLHAGSDKVTLKGIDHYEYSKKLLDKINYSYFSKYDDWDYVSRFSFKLDDTLTKYAMQRAAEVLAYAGKTRPDGSLVSTAYPDRLVFYEIYHGDLGEMWWSITDEIEKPEGKLVESAFKSLGDVCGWLDGRPMVTGGSEARALGIGCFEHNGWIAWVLVKADSDARSPIKNAPTASSHQISLSYKTTGSTHTFTQEGVAGNKKARKLIYNISNDGITQMNGAVLVNIAVDSQCLKWTSSDTAVCKVSSQGIVTPLKNGTCYVMATLPSGWHAIAKCRVKSGTLSIIAVSGSAPIALPKVVNIKKLVKGKKAFTVKWKKHAANTSGYQIRYSVKKSMAGAKTVTVSKNKTTIKVVKKLKPNNKYYVQVRAYKDVKGMKYYSSWSSKKSVRIKK